MATERGLFLRAKDDPDAILTIRGRDLLELIDHLSLAVLGRIETTLARGLQARLDEATTRLNEENRRRLDAAIDRINAENKRIMDQMKTEFASKFGIMLGGFN